MFSSHRKGFYVLFFTEMWEHAGFYVILAFLTLYLIDGSGLSVKERLGDFADKPVSRWDLFCILLMAWSLFGLLGLLGLLRRRRRQDSMPLAGFGRESPTHERLRLHCKVRMTLRSDEDVDRYLVDWHPAIHRRCAKAMTTVQKLNYLLSSVKTEEIRESFYEYLRQKEAEEQSY